MDPMIREYWPILAAGAGVVGWAWSVRSLAAGSVSRDGCASCREACRAAREAEVKRLEVLIHEGREKGARLEERIDALGEKIDSLRELVERALDARG